ncbi:MAG: chromosomal replication initiator protein DnaA [Elusimicrobia bacterium]|nr:chromosomal replication initiator protein DnaA [Elusimicrobiota bacterium]
MDVSVVDVWKKVVDNLSLSIGQESVNLWIKPVTPVSLEEDIFTISVPNNFFSQWIEKNQQFNIEQILKKEFSKEIKLGYKIEKDISEQMSKVPSIPIHPDNPVSPMIKDQLNSKYTFDRFIVGNSNRFASGCAEAVTKNPGKQFNPLFIYGGVGLGKTHLMHAIGNELKKNFPNFRILYVTCEKFASDFIEAIRFPEKMAEFKSKYRNLDCLLIDDIQFLVGKDSSQEEFFNIFNTLKDGGKQIVIASDRPQDKLEVEERLISRFKWGNTVDIQSPDTETRIAILKKKAEEEGFSVPDDVIMFIASQIKSNIRELEGTLLRVTSFIKFTNTPFTLDSVKTILKDVIVPDENAKITIDKIQQAVAERYSLTVKDLKIKKRTTALAFPRQVAMYLARSLTDMSTTEIGDTFGGRDHTTVMHAYNKISKKVEEDPFFNADVNKIIKIIKENNL